MLAAPEAGDFVEWILLYKGFPAELSYALHSVRTSGRLLRLTEEPLASQEALSVMELEITSTSSHHTVSACFADSDNIQRRVYIMEPRGQLPQSQAPANYPYPESEPSSPCLPIPLLQIPFFIIIIIILPSPSSSSKLPFPSGLPPKTLYALSCPPYVPHASPISFLIWWPRIMFYEQYISWISSLCSLLHSPVRARLKRDGTRAETRFGLSEKWTSPFKSAGESV